MRAAMSATLRRAETASVGVVRSVAELERLGDQWTELLESSGADGIFLSWEWVQAWRAAYGEREWFMLALGEERGALMGVAPFYVSLWPKPGLRAIKVLRLLGDGTDDATGIGLICRKGNEEQFARQILDQLEENGDNWNALELNHLADNRSNVAFMDEVKRRGWSVRERSSPHLSLTLPKSWDAFLSSLSQKRRAQLRAAGRKITGPNVEYRRCASASEVDEALEGLFRLHTARWKSVGKAGAFGGKQRREFYRQLSQRMLSAGKLDLWTMSMDRKLAAVEFGTICNNRRLAMQSGFDPKQNAFSVGMLLEAKVIEESIRAGVSEYDFLEGDHEFKKRWGAQRSDYNFIRCAPRGGVGGAWVRLSGVRAAQELWAMMRTRGAKV